MVVILSLVWRLVLLTGQELALEWEAYLNNSSKICLLVILDWVSLFFISTVALISARVLFYRRSYIIGDLFFARFISLVVIFIIRIGILILSPNFIRILLGWDGLGVTSYLLVIYYQSEKSFNAGIITALTNRIGDAGLLILIGIRLQIGSWSFYFYNLEKTFYSNRIVILLIFVAITKRAQIPFSSWLPAAIAAPTPVSSLVHSSTLVTAGVYLLIRLNYFLSALNALWCLLLLGVITIFIAGSAAIKEVDIKKIVALSTLSQLGLIFITLGIGLPLFSFFHLVTHAYFKAILFICIGGIIHRVKDFQDLRVTGGRLIFLPVSVRVFLVSNIRLCGIPFIAGFYSKDIILEILIIRKLRAAIFLLAMAATGLTIAYSVRLFNLVFSRKSISEPCLFLKERGGVIIIRILFLLAPSIFGGVLISWVIHASRSLVFLPFWLKIIILVVVFLSLFIAAYMPNTRKIREVNRFIEFIWFIPFLFRISRSNLCLRLRKKLFNKCDGGWGLFLTTGFLNKTSLHNSKYRGFWVNRNFIKRVIFLTVIII